MYKYLLSTENEEQLFYDACLAIESLYPQAIKRPLLMDVDNSLVQTYTLEGRDIDVYNNYVLGSVYIKSEIDIDDIFRKYRNDKAYI